MEATTMEQNKAFITALVERARAAQAVAEGYSQSIAEQALEETHMGRVDSKIAKLTAKMPSILYEVLQTKTVGIVERIPEKGIVKVAKPVGVIAALIPSTNPEATPVFKGTLGLRARNAVIFAPHPSSKGTTSRVVSVMREVLKNRGTDGPVRSDNGHRRRSHGPRRLQLRQTRLWRRRRKRRGDSR